MGDDHPYPISPSRIEDLQPRQREVYLSILGRFEGYLDTRGKKPTKEIGYAEDSISPRISRFHRAVEWIWEEEGITTEFTAHHADRVVHALETDSFRKSNGERYSEASKRKIVNVLENWCAFREIDWEPSIGFTDEANPDHADPFSRHELRELWQAALTYKSTPSYNNLSPEERDRWKADIAQDLGKPKTEVSRADWETLNTSWNTPALIRTTRAAGWRPKMVGKLAVDWYDESTRTISIPEGEAVKNDAPWEQKLDDESAMALENWLDQRENFERYDGRDEIWLTREGNPHSSGTLNPLLKNLMKDAGIAPRGRKLTWYSFRHSIGTYLYEEYRDLTIVAEVLRQKSRSSASRYVHPTPELKREAAEVM